MSDHAKRLEFWKEKKAAIAKGLPPPVWRPGVKSKTAVARNKVLEGLDLLYLLTWYEEIRRANQVGLGVNPIPFTEILAYMTLYRIDWDGFDVETLRELDDVWVKCLPKHEPKDK